MKKFLLLCLAAFVLSGCGDDDKGASAKSGGEQSASVQASSEHNAAPQDAHSQEDGFVPYKVGERFTLKSVTGGEVTIERTEKGFKLADSDKILMFDIFGTFCAPCRMEAPHLTDFQLKNNDWFMMVGLIHFEDIADAQVVEKFSKKYGAYYFIANDVQNARIVEQILNDIDYRHALAIPFKVTLKNGIYQTLTDLNEDDPKGKPYYLGAVSTDILTSDLTRIRNAN
jgi:thioredoxin domain protein